MAPSTVHRARILRHQPTEAEIRLWSLLRDRQLGYKFRRQHPVQGYILDFYCHEALLAVECDGGQHNTVSGQAQDRQRTDVLERLGIRVLRFWNNDVLQRTQDVLEEILRALPHPGPLPSGEGESLCRSTIVYRRKTLPLPLGEGRGEGLSTNTQQNTTE